LPRSTITTTTITTRRTHTPKADFGPWRKLAGPNRQAFLISFFAERLRC
jgi:hypothetical protein